MQDISTLVLWRRPFVTLYYASHELSHQIVNLTKWVLCHTLTCLASVLLLIGYLCAYHLDGPHQLWLTQFQKQLIWCLYWCGLGILSSVGLGTGLHTFLLYLGPHIASVTLAAYECESLDFPSPPYPDEIICPASGSVLSTPINVWTIMSKVRLEAFMWGAGTALGELPPYFVARAHRLAGEDEDELEPELAQQLVDGHPATGGGGRGLQLSFAQRMRGNMIRLVTKVGFFGILACASIPNPLFDLAGITCGYSLVPFWTFFGATLIGKAVIKMHIQKLFVIVAFNENYLELLVEKCRNIPYVGQLLHQPLREFLVKQKASLHRGSAKQTAKDGSWLSMIFEWVVITMILYFLVSIVNSMAQNYQKRVLKDRQSDKSAARAVREAIVNNSTGRHSTGNGTTTSTTARARYSKRLQEKRQHLKAM
ncbi:vacuole membrane protein 1-like [Oppia nitens]|uniref:vacuole membrane protein 1-like n=1 Tax=Oppia nitens TaxID=1686743 RepID=UPI0023DA1C2C|nr:vacuole membrane protein 1-like [Oppia nitens]